MKGRTSMKVRFKMLSMSAFAIATLSVGLNIPWSLNTSLVSQVVTPAFAGGNDDDQGNRGDDDKSIIKKAHCGKDDTVETGLQGQIPMPDRLPGVQRVKSNLRKTASSPRKPA